MTGFPPRLIVASEEDAPAALAARELARAWNAALETAPARRVPARAAELGAGLIVLGTHGREGLDRALLESGLPVMAVPEGAAPLSGTRILAPWNGRSYATRALRYAGLLAGSLRAELRVMRVAPDLLSVAEDESGLERRLAGILGAGGDPAWTLRVRTGNAREVIERESASGRYGLIVVSSHRRPFTSDAVLGSTAARLLKGARVPVLAVPSGRSIRELAAPARLSAR